MSLHNFWPNTEVCNGHGIPVTVANTSLICQCDSGWTGSADYVDATGLHCHTYELAIRVAYAVGTFFEVLTFILAARVIIKKFFAAGSLPRSSHTPLNGSTADESEPARRTSNAPVRKNTSNASLARSRSTYSAPRVSCCAWAKSPSGMCVCLVLLRVPFALWRTILKTYDPSWIIGLDLLVTIPAVIDTTLCFSAYSCFAYNFVLVCSMQKTARKRKINLPGIGDTRTKHLKRMLYGFAILAAAQNVPALLVALGLIRISSRLAGVLHYAGLALVDLYGTCIALSTKHMLDTLLTAQITYVDSISNNNANDSQWLSTLRALRKKARRILNFTAFISFNFACGYIATICWNWMFWRGNYIDAFGFVIIVAILALLTLMLK